MTTVDAGHTLRILRLDRQVPLPTRAHPDDAGVDLASAESVTLGPGDRALVGTGLAVGVPPGYVGLVHPRSGLAVRAGVSIVNAPGTIDAGYTGEVKVNLINLDADQPVVIERGDRIAQLLVQRVETWPVEEVAELGASERGDAGHGSTGGHGRL